MSVFKLEEIQGKVVNHKTIEKVINSYKELSQKEKSEFSKIYKPFSYVNFFDKSQIVECMGVLNTIELDRKKKKPVNVYEYEAAMFILLREKGYTYKQICQAFQLSNTTVQQKIEKAKRKADYVAMLIDRRSNNG